MSSSEIQAGAGRSIFGQDAQTYAAARPPYPSRVYEVVGNLFRAGPAARVFEVGPGTGQASEWLLKAGSDLTAIEPDPGLAAVLRERMRAYADRLTILHTPFEAADLAPASFDLGAAATSFHWLDNPRALAKVVELLRPGGAWAMWWSVFDDPTHPDAFRARAAELFDRIYAQSSLVVDGPPFALDRDRRIGEMTAAGLVDVTYEAIHWSQAFDTRQMIDLTATFSPVLMAPEADRATFLRELGAMIDRDYNGTVTRQFVTAIYTGRRPL